MCLLIIWHVTDTMLIQEVICIDAHTVRVLKCKNILRNTQRQLVRGLYNTSLSWWLRDSDYSMHVCNNGAWHVAWKKMISLFENDCLCLGKVKHLWTLSHFMLAIQIRQDEPLLYLIVIYFAATAATVQFAHENIKPPEA